MWFWESAKTGYNCVRRRARINCTAVVADSSSAAWKSSHWPASMGAGTPSVPRTSCTALSQSSTRVWASGSKRMDSAPKALVASSIKSCRRLISAGWVLPTGANTDNATTLLGLAGCAACVMEPSAKSRILIKPARPRIPVV